MNLVPVGQEVKRTEAWHANKKFHRGGGWSDRDRANFERWEADERAERWTVVEHVPAKSRHNAGSGPCYKLTRTVNGVIQISYSTPWNWEAA